MHIERLCDQAFAERQTCSDQDLGSPSQSYCKFVKPTVLMLRFAGFNFDLTILLVNSLKHGSLEAATVKRNAPHNVRLGPIHATEHIVDLKIADEGWKRSQRPSYLSLPP